MHKFNRSWIWVLLLSGVYLRADIIVFRSGSKLEVKNLRLTGQAATYTVDNMTATVPIRYVDVAATRQENSKGSLPQALPGSPTPPSIPSPRQDKQLSPQLEGDPQLQELLQSLEMKTPLEINFYGEQPPAVKAEELTSFSVPFTREKGILYVDAIVNGIYTEKFIFDTGSSVTVITPALAKKAGISPDRRKPLLISTATGRARAHVGELDGLIMGNLEIHNIPMLVLEGASENLIGQNLISQFTITVDYQTGSILLRKQ